MSSAGLRVLVADDEPSMLELVVRHLRRFENPSFTVLQASDGDEAWRLAEEQKPDLVVLDVMMPGMSGWEICRKIRHEDSLAHTGVIMLTGIGENLNQMTSPLYGADAYIDKPFDFDDFDESVRETLRARAPSREQAVKPMVNGTSGAAKPVLGGKATAKKASASKKPAAKKAPATAKKAAAKKATPKKPSVKKPIVKKPVVKKPVVKKPVVKKVIAKKPVAKKSVAAKGAKKATAKKVIAKKPVIAKGAKKPAAKKPVVAKKPAAKKSAKSATKKVSGAKGAKKRSR